jgi:Tfp pilus assembly protein PilX
LIVLIALTLAAVALTRSVGTSNTVAGNLAFQQAATHSADVGVETAVKWLEDNVNAVGVCAAGSTVTCDQTTQGYLASRADPASGQTWADFWKTKLAANAKAMTKDTTTGNTVSYVIHRMCPATGEANVGTNICATSPRATAGSCPGGTSCTGGGGRGGTGSNVDSPKQTYYRITVVVDGPRNTQSMVQAMVAI